MGRGRGKGKKSIVVTSHEDPDSGEESVPAYKKRGRPQKPLKDEIDEEEADKIEEEDRQDTKSVISNKEIKAPSVTDNGKKRKRYSQAKENTDSVKEENSVKSNGFRQNGNRRKSKPRRAAEAGVECK